MTVYINRVKGPPTPDSEKVILEKTWIKIPSPQPISFEQIAYTNMIQIEAMTNILIEKGICTRDELLKEVQRVGAELGKKQN